MALGWRAQRLLGAHLPAAYPDRRETVAGECLSNRMIPINWAWARPWGLPVGGIEVGLRGGVS